MNLSWLVITPPIIVLLLAFIWQDVIKSLLIGIALACIIAGQGEFKETVKICWVSFQESILDLQSIYIILFLLSLGVIITIIDSVGGAKRFSEFLASFIRTKKGAQFASVAMSCSLFIDDNLNTVTTGYVIHPLTDRFLIPRAKLAYLVDALAAPLTILIPLTSWVPVIMRQYEFSGITADSSLEPIIIADPYYAYLRTIPFIFYSIIGLVSVLYVIAANISYGPMAKQEQIATNTGNLFGGKAPLTAAHEGKQVEGSIIDLLAPILTLIFGVIAGILLSGGYWMLGGVHTMIETLQHANVSLVLLLSAICSLIVTIYIGMRRHVFQPGNTWPIFKQGLLVLLPAIIIVSLAGMFSLLLKDYLHTGVFFAQLASNSLSIEYFPALIFVISSAISIATGTSWGTMTVMLPIAMQMLATTIGTTPVSIDQLCLALPTLGAVLSGAVAGDQVTPHAGTTIMSAYSSGAYHMDHVITQLWYALPVFIGTFVAFIAAGKLSLCYHSATALLASLAIGIIITCLLLSLANWIYKKNI